MWLELRDAYDRCIEFLRLFRSTHIVLVTEYIMSQQKKGGVAAGQKRGALEGSAGGKGTGGTDLMSFLKPIRDRVADTLLSAPARPDPAGSSSPAPAEETGHIKDNADLGDIDLFSPGGVLERERYGW